MIFSIDIDGVLCQTEGIDYNKSVPIEENINKVNYLYSNGHIIIIQTARHWNNLKLTQNQLKKWGVNHHTLVMGNVVADFYLNDKNIFFEEFQCIT